MAEPITREMRKKMREWIDNHVEATPVLFQGEMEIVFALRSLLLEPDRLAIRIRKLMERIEAEPLATGEPAESVQIGRLQVLDELMAIDRRGEGDE